jgi:hypothetical protein
MLASAIQLQTVDRNVNSLVQFAAGYAVASFSESLSRTKVAVVDFRRVIAALYWQRTCLIIATGTNVTLGTCMWMADLRPSKRRY